MNHPVLEVLEGIKSKDRVFEIAEGGRLHFVLSSTP